MLENFDNLKNNFQVAIPKPIEIQKESVVPASKKTIWP